VIFFKRDFWAKGWSIPLLMGFSPFSIGDSLAPNQPFYSEKLESENGLCQKKNHRYWTIPWDNKVGVDSYKKWS
jgi:hypothetical protein